MPNKKDYNWFHNNVEDLQSQIDKILKSKEKSNPKRVSFTIVGAYLLLGILWISFSDEILNLLVGDHDLYTSIQLYKGWFYVGVSGLIFYLIIFKRIKLFSDSLNSMLLTYEELVAAHEELMAMEEELNVQYDELLKSKVQLEESNQRYELVIDGANDGIWDWNFLTNRYFFSIAAKEHFGYEENDLQYTIEEFRELIHPDDRENAVSRMVNYLEKKEGNFNATYRIKTKDGNYRWILGRGKALWDHQGNPLRAAGSHTDITEQREMEDKLYDLAYNDSLTKLPRMSYLREIDLFNENKSTNSWGLYLDIDDFRNINETMGHAIGDKFILRITDILKTHIKSPHIVARLSGDEFAVILLDLNEEEMIGKLNEILKDIRKPWEINNHSFFVTVSIGVVSYPEHGSNLNDLMQNADVALSHAKEKGKNNFSIFSQDMKDKAWEFVEMDRDLRIALNKQEFSLHYQPLYDIKTNKIIAAEALIRWEHPKKGFISPMEFIPFAERVGYISEITRWVFIEACRQKEIWNKKGYDPIRVSVNLSGIMVTFSDLIRKVKETLEHFNIENKGLEIEITETSIIENFESSIEVLKELRNLNLTIALDDFGTGYSSLTYLKDLPIDIIKIDRKFINSIGVSHKDDSILKYIIKLAHSLDLQVVAEGVETEEQLNFLRDNNCDIAQGYYFARPMPADELENLLSK